MNARRGGLGRGLGALIPTGTPTSLGGDVSGEVSGARFAELPLGSIRPNARQPRNHFDEDALRELVVSIQEVGLLQPVVVREDEPGRFELIMGERRWRACRDAGMDTIPAIIRDTADDAMLRDALLENLHRQELNPLEEAAAYQQLLEEFGATHEELAGRVGRSRSHISNTLRLMQLPPTVQRRLAAGVLSAGHARALLALDGGAAQDALAQRVVAEGLSVRAVEEIVAARGAPARPRSTPGPRPQHPELEEVAARLADHLETSVRVDLGRRKGRIVVEFATVEDLTRISGLLGLPSAGCLSPDRAGHE